MKKPLFVAALLALVLAFCASSWAGSVGYYSSPYWSPGSGSSSAYSSSWFYNIMSKMAKFDTTITFIDNTSYSWHSTFRGPGEYITAVWMSSAVKKAHCRSNVTSSVRAYCTVVN